MKWRDFWYFVALVALVCLCMSVVACCPCRKLGESVESTSADSVAHHQREVERINIWEALELRPLTPSRQQDVLWLWEGLPEFERADFPKLNAQTSYLENEYCHSTASVSEDGKLTHTLENNPKALLPVRHTTAERNRVDSTSFKSNTNRTEVKAKEVVRSAWYDRAVRWVSLGLFAIVIWQNRKWIGKLIGLWRI